MKLKCTFLSIYEKDYHKPAEIIIPGVKHGGGCVMMWDSFYQQRQ